MRRLIVFVFLLECTLFMYANNKKSSFFYYEKKTRISILKDLKNALKINYSLWKIKKQKFPNFSPSKIFEDAISLEKTIEDKKTAFQKAKSNLEYLNRLQKILASFKDTHLTMRTLVERPVVFNGVEFAEISGEFYTVRINNQIRQYNQRRYGKKSNFEKMSLGDLLLSVDGMKPEKFLEKFSPYISASSDGSRIFRSIKSITRRNYLYPQKSFLTWKFKSIDTKKEYSVKIPYYYLQNQRPDVNLYFSKTGIVSLKELTTVWNSKKKTWSQKTIADWQGYDVKQNPILFVPYKTYKSMEKGKSTVIETGFYINNQKAYGVVRLFSFKGKKLTEAVTKKTIGYIESIEEFVSLLKKMKTPIIIDLRNNTGGRGVYAAQLLSLLTEKEKKYPPSTWMFRITPMIQQMYETLNRKDKKSGRNKEARWAFKFIDQAIKEKKNHTLVFNRIPLVSAHKGIGGYSQKVVVMTGSECVSTCDMFLSLVKSSKRGVVIGDYTNGTGAGAATNKKFDSTEWTDYYKVVKVKIPNSLFGIPQKISEKQVKNENLGIFLNMENNPTKPDVFYQSTLEDYLKRDKKWYDKAVEFLQ